MKKTILGLVFASLIIPASGAHASVPSPDVRQIARVLVNNTDVTHKLKEHNLDAVTDLEITKISEGVLKYQMHFTRFCECLPMSADVKIIEDLRPTERDGEIQYESSIKLNDERR